MITKRWGFSLNYRFRSLTLFTSTSNTTTFFLSSKSLEESRGRIWLFHEEHGCVQKWVLFRSIRYKWELCVSAQQLESMDHELEPRVHKILTRKDQRVSTRLQLSYFDVTSFGTLWHIGKHGTITSCAEALLWQLGGRHRQSRLLRGRYWAISEHSQVRKMFRDREAARWTCTQVFIQACDG